MLKAPKSGQRSSGVPGSGASRDDDRFAGDLPALQVQAEQVAVAVGVDFTAWYGLATGPELQRLSTARPADRRRGRTGRSSSRSGSCRGLPAGADGVQQHGVQALDELARAASRRARADDVTSTGLVDGTMVAEAELSASARRGCVSVAPA